MTIHIQMLQDIATHARAMADAMGQLGIPDATARIYDTVTALVRK